MKIFYSSLSKIYDSIQLNLGIKTFVKERLQDVKRLYDHKVIYRLYQQIEKYIFNETIRHYGADYKWGDEQSQNLDKKTNNYGYGLFHYSMIRNQKPRKILCVGSMYGYIPYMLTKACMDNGFGKVDFVDASYNFSKKSDKKVHYFGQGFWNEKTADRHFSYFLDSKYIKTHVMTTQEFAEKYKKNTYDYIYLDGDHSYQGALLDMKLFWPRLNKEGFISFHDIHLRPEFLSKNARKTGLEFGYRKIWSELIKQKTFKFELSNHYSGLGFIQKM